MPYSELGQFFISGVFSATLGAWSVESEGRFDCLPAVFLSVQSGRLAQLHLTTVSSRSFITLPPPFDNFPIYQPSHNQANTNFGLRSRRISTRGNSLDRKRPRWLHQRRLTRDRTSLRESDTPMPFHRHQILPSSSTSPTPALPVDSTQRLDLLLAWRESSRSISRQMPSLECPWTWWECQESLMVMRAVGFTIEESEGETH